MGSLAILLGVMSISIAFAGIHTAEAKTTEETDKKLNIVTTIFPEYDWTRVILGDRADDVNLTMLLDNGTDLHSFQPAVKDIMKVSSCDLLIYVGGESDQWIEDALESAQNKDMKTINLMEVLGDSIKEEETVEGMQESDHDHDHDHEDEEEKEYDEHVWTSMRNAEVICDAIAETLEEMDPENKEIYQSNAETYKEKLSALDEEYQEKVDSAKQKTLIFADRFPFRYLVDDYGISYYAAFSGCSAESEASFKTITFLAGKVDELGLKDVFTIVHEMGHSMHSFYTRKTQPFTYGDHSIFTAEVASTVNESLLMQHLLQKETDPEMRKYLVNYYIEEFRTTLFRQTMFAEFEMLTHKEVENGGVLTAEWLCEVYDKLNKDYFGPALAEDEYIKYEWARIPHFYRSFYVYQYATGYSAATAISKRILTEGEKARTDYIEFLKSGSSDYPVELLKIAGVDMSSPAPIRAAMETFQSLVEELETFL